jgi:hypothetical protein
MAIFDKLVTDENSYTQLLRNLMIQSDDFRRRVLGVLFPEEKEKWTSRIVPTIETQVDLSGFGRADILIRTAELCAIVEVKISLWCGLTGNQNPAACEENELKGYRGWCQKEANRRLVFLVPRRWIHADELLQKSLNLVYWEDVLRAIETSNSDPFVDEFRKLLDDRFGTIKFSEEEINMLQSQEFPVAFHTVRKVQYVIEEIADKQLKKEHYKFRWGCNKEEYGIYCTQDNKDVLWFGMWDELLQECGAITFGVHERCNPKVIKAFSACCTQDKTKQIEGDGKWTVSWISNEVFESSDPVEQVWKELKSFLDAVYEASRTSSGR